MTEKAAKTKLRLVVLLLWILLAYFYSSLAYEYIVASNKDKKLDEYLQYLVVLAGDDHRPTKEVRSLVVTRAEELKLPVRGDQVTVTGGGQTLQISVSFVVDINMPVLRRSIYQKVFHNQASYRNIR